jgi:ketosteroid isomerase-like protein
MSRVETAVRTVLAFHEAFNRHDVAAMMTLTSEDTVFESPEPPPDGGTYAGKNAVAAYWAAFFERSPKAHIEIEEIFGLGMRCVMRWRYDWTDGSGERGHVRGVDVYLVRNDQIQQKLSYVKG